MSGHCDIPVVHCGKDREHAEHIFIWRKVVLDSDLTGDTTARRYCTGEPKSQCDICAVVGEQS